MLFVFRLLKRDRAAGSGGSARGGWLTAGNHCLIMPPLFKQHAVWRVGEQKQQQQLAGVMLKREPRKHTEKVRVKPIK